ncbi:MAG: SMP-30/gluconolactonase/LRE family protein [Dehalococcoidia bacterium]|nr:SMP-30/gluconolactonase/LRE family protein [Dehalococcoidia bacterium]
MATLLIEGLKGAEGPVWMPDDGSLVLTEGGAGRLTRIAPDGTASTYAATGGSPNGAAMGPDRKLFVTNSGGKCIQVVHPDRTVEVLYDNCEGEPFNGPNDLTFDEHGGFYFTDPGHVTREGVQFGRLYYGLADGSLVKRTQHIFIFPNGLALTRGGTSLVVLESITGRVWSIPVESPGTLAWADAGARAGAPRRGGGLPGDTLLTVVPKAGLPDGMCIDEAGNLLICAANSGFVSVHAPDGTPITLLDAGDPRPTNICFGGPNGRTLYITGLGEGRVTTIEWERGGLPLPNY